MKALCKSILFLALGAFAFTACEDVPAPYGIPTDKTEASGDKDVLLEQSFKTSLGEFSSLSASGDLAWINDYSSACITGYKDFDGDGTKENKAGVTYLVGPQVDLTGVENAYAEIKQAMRYERGDVNANNTLLISKDYAGSVTTATWEALPYSTDGLNGDQFTFEKTRVAIPAAYMGQKVTFAFRHTCTDKQSSTWEVQEFKVVKGAVEEETPDTPDTPEPPAEGEIFAQSFKTTIAPFTSMAKEGALEWINDYSSACITGYKDYNGDGTKENQAGVTFLVSPEIDLAGVENAYIELKQALNYERADINTNNSLVISKDFTGDVSAATWEVLPYKTDGLNSSFTFVTDKSIVIPAAYMGQKVRIAFRHTCTDKQSSTWEVQEFKVMNGAPEATPDTPDTPDTPEGEGKGTLEAPYTVAQVAKMTAATSSEVYVKGIISEIKNVDTGTYGNAEYFISDNGASTGQIKVFRGYFLNGAKFTSADQIKVGDEVVVLGQVAIWYEEAQIAQGSKIVTLNSNGGGNTDGGEEGDDNTGGEVSGNSITIDPNSFGLANNTPLTTLTLTDGTTMAFDANGNKTKPAFYTTGGGAFRIYPSNKIEIAAGKTIQSITITCSIYNNITCNASGALSASQGTLKVDDTEVTINGINSANVTINNTSTSTGTASQFRIKSMVITYAE